MVLQIRFTGSGGMLRFVKGRAIQPRRTTLAAMNKRILIVDDDPELRELLRGYLGGNGFEVDVAEDGAAMRQAHRRRGAGPGDPRPDAAGRGRPRAVPRAARQSPHCRS